MSTVSNGFHHLPSETVLALLGTTRSGLEEREAERRLAEYGPNRLPEPKGKTVLTIFVGQFRSPFIYLLSIAAVVSVWLKHVIDAAFIFVVLLGNAAIGTYQEWRAETRARALKKLVQGSASVWRNMVLVRLPVERLVPGDIIQLESGDKVAADIRLIEAQGLMADESLLTGESLAVQKSADAALPMDALLGERVTMLHAGTTIQRGRATGVVAATGSRTSVGRLAAVLETKEPAPPLVRRMAIFTRQVAVAMIGIIAVIAVIEVLRGATASEIFLLGVALAVSAIPEGLPVAMTVALSIAMHRMGLRNVVVRRLTAVEGLGACTLIATDKTGTLTLNQLTIEKLWLPRSDVWPPEHAEAAPLLLAASYASEPPAAGGKLVGDAVDLAFFASARAHGWKMDDGTALLLERIPYEPEKRFAAAFHKNGTQIAAYVKGAPETILPLCRTIDDRAIAAFHQLSSDGYRVIAVAAGPAAAVTEDALSNLSFLGFAALIDPLRPEAQSAVAAAQSAGLRVVMVTGDHPLTALAIARQLDLAHERAEVITGDELAKLEGGQFDRAVGAARVFARTEPLQKLAIVESLRRQGYVVAVTGDGINDAAALHAADIGVAMGKGGTDVAREAADLILTDDNFASIVAGIEEGRIAYDNLRKVILLTISTGAAEILLFLLATISGFPPPLTAVQLLWLNLITNGMQDVALAFEKGEPGVLRRRPRLSEARIFDRAMIEQVVISGLAIGVTTFVFYRAAISAGMEHGAAQGAVLWLLVWCENAHCFNCRSETRSAFQVPVKDNILLVGAVIGTQIIQIAALGIPSLGSFLSLQALTARDGLALAGGGLAVLAVMEIYKFLRRIRAERSELSPLSSPR